MDVLQAHAIAISFSLSDIETWDWDSFFLIIKGTTNLAVSEECS